MGSSFARDPEGRYRSRRTPAMPRVRTPAGFESVFNYGIRNKLYSLRGVMMLRVATGITVGDEAQARPRE